MIHAIITIKYHEYSSTEILKHANVLVEVIKSTYVSLSYITPYKICTSFHSTYTQRPHKKLVVNERSQI